MIRGRSFLTGRSLISWNSIKIHDIRVADAFHSLSTKLIPDDTIAILSSKSYLFHIFSPSNFFLRPFSYHVSFFFSPFPRSFRSFASYRIQYTRYVCRSISCIVPGYVGWLRRAYRSRMKKEVRRNSSRQSFFDHLKCAPCGWSILEKKRLRLLFLIIRDLTFFVFWFLYVLLAVNILNAY